MGFQLPVPQLVRFRRICEPSKWWQRHDFQGINYPICSMGLEYIPTWYPKQTFVQRLFQLDDSKSLHGKWLEITISIHFKLVGFGLPGIGMASRYMDGFQVHGWSHTWRIWVSYLHIVSNFHR